MWSTPVSREELSKIVGNTSHASVFHNRHFHKPHHWYGNWLGQHGSVRSDAVVELELVLCTIFAHVEIAGFNPDRIVYDPVHYGVGMNTAA